MHHEKLIKSLLVKDFRSFYEDLVRLKAKALSGELIAEAKADEEDSEATHTTLCRQIQEHLLAFLTAQHDYIERHGGGFALRYYREAQYIMVALADEIFLNMEWVGREEWRANLLETKIFNTQVAGEKIFTNLDQFLEVRDSANSDIGVLYIFALGLGFKGKYRDMDDHGELKEYREQLQARVMHGSPYALQETQRLFPEAYIHTIDGREGEKVPTAQRWAMILLGVIGVYMILAYFIWAVNVRELDIMIESVMQWVKAQ